MVVWAVEVNELSLIHSRVNSFNFPKSCRLLGLQALLALAFHCLLRMPHSPAILENQQTNNSVKCVTFPPRIYFRLTFPKARHYANVGMLHSSYAGTINTNGRSREYIREYYFNKW